MDATPAQPGLGDGEGLALPAQQAVGRNADLVVVDQGMHALILGFTGQADVADHVDAGRVRGDQEHGGALVDADVGIGDGHHDQEGGGAGVGGEELPPVDHPLVAVAYGTGGELLGIRPGLGFGHGVTGEDLAVQQRLKVRGLLLVGTVVGDDLGVPRVGGLRPEHDGCPAGDPEDLVQQGQLELPIAFSAQLRAEVGGPQVVVPNLLLHGVHDGAQLVVQRVELQMRIEQVQRLDSFGHEFRVPSPAFLETRAR